MSKYNIKIDKKYNLGGKIILILIDYSAYHYLVLIMILCKSKITYGKSDDLNNINDHYNFALSSTPYLSLYF